MVYFIPKLIPFVNIWLYGSLQMDEKALITQQEQQLSADRGCALENMLRAMDDRDGWGERERERESGKSVLAARLKDDVYIYIFDVPLQTFFNCTYCNKHLLYGIKYSYLIQIICIVNGFNHFNLIQVICTQFHRFEWSYLIPIIYTQL